VIARRPARWLAAGLLITSCAAGPAIDARSAVPATSTSTPSSSTTTTDRPRAGEPEPRPSAPDRGGDDGIGDELFPDLGNPGLDVTHYDVDITYDPADQVIHGDVTLSITPTEDRDEFTLDAVDLDVAEVLVDGQPARFETEAVELRIRPPAALVAGRPVTVDVTYTGAPKQARSAVNLPSGWFATASGSYVLNEPDGMRRWAPSNDHPSDKATWRFSITVPEGLTGVANGRLVDDHGDGAGHHVWVWDEPAPMATYLVQLLTGRYDLVDGTSPAGAPLSSVVLHDRHEAMQPYLDGIGEQLDWFAQQFGPYPFDRYGIAITDSAAGLAMEQQGRAMFSIGDLRGAVTGEAVQALLAHELAHQWFGDAVTPATWHDIWLNESFATYAQWLWFDHTGLESLDDLADAALRSRPLGSPADPDLDDMFGAISYDGGAVVLQALRRTIGDGAFFTLLRRWAGDNAGTSRTTSDFVALADEVSGRDLGGFFDDWLFADRPPARYPSELVTA
jgi:aminopeptidase N